MTMDQDFILRSPATFGDFTVQGKSRAGIGTSISIPSLGVCFDLANGVETAWPSPIHLISHGHMDHAGGIPYVISQRGLHGLPSALMYMPESIVAPMIRIMEEWSAIEGFEYQYEFRPALPGISIPVKNNWEAIPFTTVHRVPSVGYTLVETRKTLKSEYRGLTEFQLAEKARSGVELSDMVRVPRISFTGDTQIEVVGLTRLLRESEIVFIEVTYFGGRGPGAARTVADARAWGHIHFEELLEALPTLEQVKHLVLIHASRRHSYDDINEVLNRALPENWKTRVSVFT